MTDTDDWSDGPNPSPERQAFHAPTVDIRDIGGTVTDTDDRLCDVCSQLVPDEEAHLPHETGCSQEGCRCDFHVHPECCWRCEPNPRAPGHRWGSPLPNVTWGSLAAIQRQRRQLQAERDTLVADIVREADETEEP